LVLIGLTEHASQYEERGYTPLRGALGQVRFRRYGMPFAPNPKDRVSATARACRAIVATRLAHPGSEWAAFRALQFANFTTRLLLDDDEGLRDVLSTVPGIDADAIVSSLDSPEVNDAYKSDRAETREAEGSAAELQGKTATSDEPLLHHFRGGVTTQEVAALMTPNTGTPDREAAEAAMVELVAAGKAVREPLGDDALWKPAE
jgi:hypothetical protein